MIKGLVTAAMLVTGVSAATSASAANLLTNASFETGDFTGWNLVTNNTDGQAPVVIRYGQASAYPTGAFGEAVPADPLVSPSGTTAGNFGAYFASDKTTGDILRQSVTLAPLTNYTFGFDYYLPFNGYGNAGDASFTAAFAGTTFATFQATQRSPGVWYTVSGSFTTDANPPAVGDLAFTYTSATNAAYGKDFVIDVVYLSETSALVPEPASWAMMVVGFGLMGTMMRRKRTIAFA